MNHRPLVHSSLEVRFRTLKVISEFIVTEILFYQNEIPIIAVPKKKAHPIRTLVISDPLIAWVSASLT